MATRRLRMQTFIDARNILVKHETKKFRTRDLSQIKGVVVHHTAGGDDPFKTARYHVGPNHVSDTGCPGLLYTLFIKQSGEIYWANDLEAVTWSQGGRGSPIEGANANSDFLAIVCGGDFTNGGPSIQQTYSLLRLILHLTGEQNDVWLPTALFGKLICDASSVYGHHNFGKPACPGSVLTGLVDGFRSHASKTQETWSAEVWQKALVQLGYLEDGQVDGIWGRNSRAALVLFQSDKGLVEDGLRGPRSKAALSELYKTLY